MEYIELSIWRLLVIDGSELNAEPGGGRVVCINGTGDTPLFMLTIDPTKCEPAVPIVGRLVPELSIAPVPEPSIVGALIVSALASRLWFYARARSDKRTLFRTSKG